MRTAGFFRLLMAGSLAMMVPLHAAAEAAPSASNGQSEANPFTNDGAVAMDPSTYPRPRVRPDRLRLEISRRDCRRLVIGHEPADDVEYRPGVDVRGRPVVPAETGYAFAHVLPDVIRFDLRIDPLARTGLDPDLFRETGLTLGEVRYDIRTGLLTLDGRPLTDSLKVEIEKRCRAAGFLD